MIKQPLIKILVITDDEVFKDTLKEQTSNLGQTVFQFCSDNISQTVNEFKPALVFVDKEIKYENFKNLLTEIKASLSEKNIRVIVFANKVENELLIDGVSDILEKFLQKDKLISKIFYHLKAASFVEDEAVREIQAASEYIYSLLPPKENSLISVDWLYMPSKYVGGDSFGYRWYDDKNFLIYIIDVVGHGLQAALHTSSILHVLNHPSDALEKELLSPDIVLNILNHEFQMDHHFDLFFSIWYGVFNIESRMLTYSSGGHPPGILISQKHENVSLTTDNELIGVHSNVDYKKKSLVILEKSHILLFTDGVFNIKKKEGSMASFEEFFKFVSQKGHSKSLLNEIGEDAKMNESFADDLCLIEITV